MPMSGHLKSSPLKVAGLVWVLAGAIYLLAEAVSASAFTPAYSYAHNFISDLGVAGCGGQMQGRPICSPLHDVMNGAFVLEGVGFLIAAAIAGRALTGALRWVFVALAAIHAVGMILVGVFHGSDAAVADGTGIYHVLGATLAIFCGNLTGLCAAGLPPWRQPVLRGVSIILPVLGIVSVVCLIQSQTAGVKFPFADGTLERGSVYSITAWQMVTGLYFLRRRPAVATE